MNSRSFLCSLASLSPVEISFTPADDAKVYFRRQDSRQWKSGGKKRPEKKKRRTVGDKDEVRRLPPVFVAEFRRPQSLRLSSLGDSAPAAMVSDGASCWEELLSPRPRSELFWP